MPTNDPKHGSGTVPVPTPKNTRAEGADESPLGASPLDVSIRARAHELWEEEGRPHGKDLEHWEKAAAELKAAVGK